MSFDYIEFHKLSIDYFNNLTRSHVLIRLSLYLQSPLHCPLISLNNVLISLNNVCFHFGTNKGDFNSNLELGNCHDAILVSMFISTHHSIVSHFTLYSLFNNAVIGSALS